jgi:hypothetical protein
MLNLLLSLVKPVSFKTLAQVFARLEERDLNHVIYCSCGPITLHILTIIV